MNPDALAELQLDLVTAYFNETGLTYGGKIFSKLDIKSMLESLDVWMLPCANPDGREYAITPAGLVFGRPYGYTDEDARFLWDVVEARTEAAGLPVLANVELGHADPMVTLPLGVCATVDAGGRSFRLDATPTAG